MRRILFATALALTALPSMAMAHATLLSSTPAAGATVVRPTGLSLTFSETMQPPLSGIDLTMTGMPGMTNHAPMPVKGFRTAVEGDGKTMTITLPRALPAGDYDIDWHFVGADQHRTSGKISFSVK
ncbi:copper homeostasis periplasmic binding protein CopC [Sphingobium sp. EM0848]|uniref:copper homeostasis periplasmic binding protein CopC n=1 Tax=Sphingobium sp. EM0848 TaxID=2743473 RepID=UPI00159BFEB4|nr:copper homeostasis periplasmic binding protein CopC [Sphingobium sp. EM0848]